MSPSGSSLSGLSPSGLSPSKFALPQPRVRSLLPGARLVLSTFGFAVGFAAPLLAGPNRDGVLLLHAQPEIVYSSTDVTHCAGNVPASCEQVTTELGRDRVTVVTVLAAFHPDARPRLSGASFGLRYPDEIGVLAHGSCADFELCQPGWPRSGYGTAIAFNAPRQEHLVPLYWLAIRVEDPELATIELIAHPIQGASFADDTTPARIDEVAGMGSLGIGWPGSSPCSVDYKPTGACCLTDATCKVVSMEVCTVRSGYYFGHETVCEPVSCEELLGACCIPAGYCNLLSRSDCATIEDATFLGWGTTCDRQWCPFYDVVGACCIGNRGCLAVTYAQCLAQDGLFLGGNELSACDPNPCPAPPAMGACCFVGGSCRTLIEDDCLLRQGSSWTAGGTCDPVPCSPEMRGACCTLNGSCVVTSEAMCSGSQGEAIGVYLGDDVACDPSPCPLPSATGACCQSDGTCAMLPACLCDCSGSIYLGNGALCAPSACAGLATGACCLADGTCLSAISSACADRGGTYQGADTVCLPDPCPHPDADLARVACCFTDGTCLLTGTTECERRGGSAHGSAASAGNAACEPSPCPALAPAVLTSWGGVKARFR